MAEGCVNLQVLLSALAVLVGGAAAADEIVLPKSWRTYVRMEAIFLSGSACHGGMAPLKVLPSTVTD